MTPRRQVAFIDGFRVAVFFLAPYVCGIPAVVAQTADATHGPLFGADSRSGARHRSLDMTVSVANARDEDLGADQGTGASPLQPRIGGQYSDLDASLSLAHTRQHFSVTARATGSVRHYPTLNSFVGSNDSAATELTVALGRKTTFQTRLDGSYVSSFAFDTFLRRPGTDYVSASATGVEEASLDWTRTLYGGTANLTRLVGRRSSFSLIYGLGHGERRIVGERSDEQTVAAQVGRSVGRDASIRAAYAFRQGTQRMGDRRTPLRSHDAQMSLERQWRHSTFRRTVVSLSGGPSLLQQGTIRDTTIGDMANRDVNIGGEIIGEVNIRDVTADPTALQKDQTDRLFRVVGTVAVAHDVSRAWSARVSYRRGAGLRDAVFFSNTAALDVRGGLGRRVGLTVSAGYTDGDIDLGTPQDRNGNSFGSARIQVALARFMAVYGQYFLYHYDFRTDTSLPAGYPRQMDRRGLRVGVTLWIPLQRG